MKNKFRFYTSFDTEVIPILPSIYFCKSRQGSFIAFGWLGFYAHFTWN